MDAFYVSVELRRRPELRGRPVIVAGSGPRSVVTTASYEARAFGVGSAVPAARARRLCPHGVFLTPDFAYYREASAEVMGIVRRRVETVEVVGLDEVYLDLTGLVASGAVMRGIVHEIERHTDLTASVGIGPNKLVAKVASDAEKPRGFVVLSREEASQRFAGAPCGLVPGIGPKTADRLAGLGVATLSQLREIDRVALARAFGGRMAGELQRRARFEDESPVTQQRKVISESRETTFPSDIADLDALTSVLDELVTRLCEALVDQDRCGRTVGIKIRLDDFSTHTRARTLGQPVARQEEVGPVARELLERFGVPRPVRLLGVRVAGLQKVVEGPPKQLTLAV
jgi:DNA polymerase-4